MRARNLLFDVAVFLMIGVIGFITGCVASSEPSLVSPPTQTEQLSILVVTIDKPDIALESIVSQALSISEDSVAVRDVEPMDWMDLCLGLPQPSELCAQVVTPGFQATVDTAKGKYRVTGDRAKRNLRLQPINATLE